MSVQAALDFIHTVASDADLYETVKRLPPTFGELSLVAKARSFDFNEAEWFSAVEQARAAELSDAALDSVVAAGSAVLSNPLVPIALPRALLPFATMTDGNCQPQRDCTKLVNRGPGGSGLP